MPKDENKNSSRKFFSQEFYSFLRKNKFTIFLVVITVLSLVIQISLSMSTWGHVHADEVFQSLEVAHDIVYGYGHLPPEYQQLYPSYPSYGNCRSHLFPFLFTVPMYIGKALNWDYWKVTLPLIRILLGINGALITPSTYFLVKKYTKEKKIYAIVSSFFVTISPVMWLYSFRSLTNIFFVPWLFFLIVLYWRMVEKIQNKINEGTNTERKFLHYTKNIKYYSTIALASVFVGLILYIRIDLIIGIAAILLLKFPYKKIKIYLSHIVGFAIAITIGGFIDLVFYGDFLISPINWLKFNIIEGNSAVLFGEKPFSYYFLFTLKQPIALISFLLTFVIFITLILRSLDKNNKSQRINLSDIKILGGLLLAELFILILFSIPKHKEVRFIYIGVIYFHISLAISVVILFRYLIPKMSLFTVNILSKRKSFLDSDKAKRIGSILYIILIVASFLSGILVLNTNLLQTEEFWNNNGIARGLAYIGNQDDVTGILLFAPWYKAKMYTYLHRNISMDDFLLKIDPLVLPDLVILLNKTGLTHNYALIPTILFEEMSFLDNFLAQSNFVFDVEIRNETRIYVYSN